MKPYYEDSAVQIFLGDCRDFLSVRVDMVLTDPPYNVNLGTGHHSERQNGYVSNNDSMTQAWYNMRVISPVLCLIESFTTIITPGNSNQHLYPKPNWTMCWTKANGVTRTPLTRGQQMNHACWEPVLIYGKLANPPHSDVINVPIGLQSECDEHPCPKPFKLFSTLISFTDAQFILDPFMGSGTTLVAAKSLGRKAIGIEIEEKYCAIAAQRLEQEYLPLNGFHEPPHVEEELVLAI